MPCLSRKTQPTANQKHGCMVYFTKKKSPSSYIDCFFLVHCPEWKLMLNCSTMKNSSTIVAFSRDQEDHQNTVNSFMMQCNENSCYDMWCICRKVQFRLVMCGHRNRKKGTSWQLGLCMWHPTARPLLTHGFHSFPFCLWRTGGPRHAKTLTAFALLNEAASHTDKVPPNQAPPGNIVNTTARNIKTLSWLSSK